MKGQEAPEDEIVFVVDVSSFTKKGFIGSSKFGGKPVDLEFEDGDEGVSLTREASRRLGVQKGSLLSVVVEDDRTQSMKTAVARVGSSFLISDSKIYYAVGKEGGAIVRIRKA